jgi:hypothetical protein
MACKEEGRNGREASTSWGIPKTASQARETPWNRFFTEPSVLIAWSQTSGLLDCETINFRCLRHSFCSNLLWQIQETKAIT